MENTTDFQAMHNATGLLLAALGLVDTSYEQDGTQVPFTPDTALRTAYEENGSYSRDDLLGMIEMLGLAQRLLQEKTHDARQLV